MRAITKKLLGIFAVATLSGLAAQAQTYSNAVMSLSPVAYWPLNETNAGPTAYIATNRGTLGASANAYYNNPYPDSLGSPNYTLFTGPVPGVTSDGDSAASFSGSANGDPTGYMIIPHANRALTTPIPFTTEVWVQPGGGDPNDPSGSSYASTEWTSIIKEGFGGLGWGDGFDAHGNAAGWSIALSGIYSTGYPVGWYTPGPVQLLTNATWIVDFYSGTNGQNPSLEFDVPMYEPSPAWFHLVLVYDGTNANFYTNGVLAATTVPGLPQSTNMIWAPGNAPITTATGVYAFTPTDGVSYTPDYINPVVLGDINTSGNIYNEGYPSTANGTIGFNNQIYEGYMDEVAIYSNALSSTMVAKHFADATASNTTLYTNDVLSAKPLVYLRLDEPAYVEPDPSTFAVANNYGTLGASANGVYQPGTVPGVPGAPLAGLGPDDFAVAFNGLDAAVDIGDQTLGGSLLDPSTGSPFSLVYWFKGNPADSYARFQGTIGRGDHGWRSSVDGQGEVRWNPGGGPELNSAKNYNDGAWHYFAGVTDGTNVFLYVDGELSASNGPVGSLGGSPFDVLIGGAPDYTITKPNGSSERYFAGSISQAAFFTNSLTEAQVQTLYFSAGVPPAIITEPPASVVIVGGATGTIAVTAAGSPTLTYIWYQNGSKLSDTGAFSGTGTSILTINDAQPAESGAYTVVITNLYGSVTSTVANVTVRSAPTIVTEPEPASSTVYAGNHVSFNVGATGATPLTYQWYMGTTPIGGATGSNFVLTAIAGSNNYSVVVSNNLGSQTSSVVSVVGLAFVPPASGFAVNYNDPGNGAYKGLGAYNDDPANTNWNVFSSPPGGTTGDAVTSSGDPSLVTFSINYGFNNGPNNAGYQGSPCYLVEVEAGINSGNPGVGTSANPMGEFSFNDVPPGAYTLYVYSANYDGNRGSIITLANANGGQADNGINATVNSQSDHTCDTLVEGDNYVFFHDVVPDSTGTITGFFIPNPAGVLTGEGQINAVQLVLDLATIQHATGGNVTLTFSGGTLQSAPTVNGPWTTVTATSPASIPATGSQQYFRVY